MFKFLKLFTTMNIENNRNLDIINACEDNPVTCRRRNYGVEVSSAHGHSWLDVRPTRSERMRT